MTLVMDPERIRFACNPFANPAWAKASQMTTGVDGVMAADAFREGRRSIDEWAARLTEALSNGPEPGALALKVTSIPKKEPWETVAGEPLERRDIVGRNILGRCFSNHLASVLQETSEAVLPSGAIAYRPDRPDVVQVAILKVATAIGLESYRYWAKLDVRDCFNQLPRHRVAESLRALGFPERFIKLVMASVGAPRFRRVQGTWVEQNSEKGCPAGLPESAILVNVLFATFDKMIEKTFRGVLYLRYSDDLLFVGRTRGEVEKAVGELLKWVKGMGLRLKAVSPNQSARSLVHDTQERRLVFLGAEIGADGDIHIPANVVEGQLARVRYMMDRAALASTLVVGQSRYAGSGRRARGVETHDWDDVRASIIEFHRYWFALNQGEAAVFLGRVREEFRVNPLSDAGPYRKVWVAALGHTDNLIGGGHEADRDRTSAPLDRWVRREVIPLIKGALRDGSEEPSWDVLVREGDLDPRGTSEPWDEEPSEGLPSPEGHQNHEEAATSWDTPATGDSKGSPGTGSDVNERYCSAIGACGLSAAPRGPAISGEASGATTLGSAPPPGQPWGSDPRLVFLRHEYEPETTSTTVTTDEFDGDALGARFVGTWAMTYEGMPAESAVLEHLIRRARSAGQRPIIVAMHDAWLAKLLLQEGREFRSVGLFQRVRALHAIGRATVILGPVMQPQERAGISVSTTALMGGWRPRAACFDAANV